MNTSQDEVIAREREYWEARSDFEWLSEASIKKVIAAMSPLRGDVLELCSGSGMFTKRIPATYETYTCLDLSESLLNTLSQELPQITPIQGNAEEPDFPRGSFDTVVVFAGLHHLPDVHKAIRSAYRILRPGGSFACFEPNEDWWYRKPMLPLRNLLGIYTSDEKFLKPADVLAAVEKVGFQNIAVQYLTPTYHPSSLKTPFPKMLASMIRIASNLNSAPNWQSFFVISGQEQ